jgi:hypothetical protein
VFRPGERHVETVRALVDFDDLAILARSVPQPQLFTGLVGEWDVIA